MWSVALFAGLSHAGAVDLPPVVPPGEHARQLERYGGAPEASARRPAAAPPPTPTPGPDVTVYGYQAYWDDDLSAVPWDDLTHIALFAAEADSAGHLSYTSRWDDAATAVALAAPYGVRVHLCVLNFSTPSLTDLLGSETSRETLLDELESWVLATGAHGVNVDFEGLPTSRRLEMVDFVADLAARVGEVVVATPPVDWSGAWDFAALSQHADLFLMGYNYHWAGSSEAGPTDPLFSGAGTVWASPYSLAWSVDDHLTAGADPARVILGLPLYGYRWPTADDLVPTATLGTGSSIFMAEALAGAALHGANHEPTSVSNWFHDGSDQVWYPDVDTIRARVRHVTGAGIGGVGFWALHYDDDDPALWAMVREETVVAPTTGDTAATDTGTVDPGAADPGPPLGEADTGGVVAGDPADAPLDAVGCGCAHAGGAHGWLALAPIALWARRRRP